MNDIKRTGRRRKFNDKQAAIIIEYKQTLSFREIANLYGVTRSTIWNYVRKYYAQNPDISVGMSDNKTENAARNEAVTSIDSAIFSHSTRFQGEQSSQGETISREITQQFESV